MINRSLLLGFGAGLVFAAGFMMVFPVAGNQGAALNQKQLEEAAAALNMVLVPKEQTQTGKEEKKVGEDLKQPPTTPTTPHAPAAPSAGTGKGTPSQPSASKPSTPVTPSTKPGAAPALPTAPADQKAPTSPTPTAPMAPAKNISFSVTPGMTSAKVAAALVKQGILPANNRFVAKLRDQNKLNRIRTGSYQIPQGISEDELIRLLTTPPRK